jgi:hypothetical protein
MIYFCCDNESRRNEVQKHAVLNGIDFLEVLDQPGPLDQRQRTLLVYFLKNLNPGELKVENIRIEGGERITNIKVTKVSIGSLTSPPLSPPANKPNVLLVEVSAPGDFSTYILRLLAGPNSDQPPANFDPVLSTVDFSFKVSCPSDFDCPIERLCPPEKVAEPEISYLAKDYASFRQLMLDRMALLTPNWKERSSADLGIALIELLAYVGDYLSYQQDAVATEAYLGTARRRASVRRHARLVDYFMHDGRNARAWVQIAATAAADGLTLEKGAGDKTTKLLTRVAGQDATVLPQTSDAFADALLTKPLVFELLHNLTLYEAHNEIKFYTWKSRNCCLPQGATRATLRDSITNRLRLRAGDVLIFEERKGPQTGNEADADRNHRHAVLLKKVSPEAILTQVNDQPVRTPGNLVTDPLNGDPIVQIEWARADALPFPLCISAESATGFEEEVSVALGNIVLADHGMTFSDTPSAIPFDPEQGATSLSPDTVSAANPTLKVVSNSAADRCATSTETQPKIRYRPVLARSPLTHAAPYPAKPASAASLVEVSTEDRTQFPLPSIQLSTFADQSHPEEWKPVHDLLESEAGSKEFVAEVETDGRVYLRFGDGEQGSRAESGTRFFATYRIGNGAAGNIGADSLSHLVSSILTDSSMIQAVRNPLRAQGGIEMESIEEVRQNAPSAFRAQERAVTPADYEEICLRPALAENCKIAVQRVAATPRWTGSWHTTFLTVDPLGGEKVDSNFEATLEGCLERFRMAGQDLEIDAPHYVSLEVEMGVCLKPGYLFSHVKKALLDVFSDRVLPDNTRGMFHSDNLTFNQSVYLSALIAAAQNVSGVESVVVRKFQRQRVNSQVALQSGKLEIGRLEIARLSNNKNFPERGSFKVTQG